MATASRAVRRRRTTSTRPMAALGLGTLVLLLLPSVPGLASGPSARSTAARGTGSATLVGAAPARLGNATFQLISGAAAGTISDQYWGADVRIYSPANSTLADGFNDTGLSFVRWPGGAVADQYNLTTNRIYHQAGAYITPPSSILQFAHWCQTVSCRAIVQLPGEIDDPGAAAADVRYIETVAHFHPAYYEIGNEPALWHHFGIPWSNWTKSQRSKVTAVGYAHVVQAYTIAIRSVDRSAKIIGLPGFGQGGYHEPTWVQASVAVNGPNLSAVAIHVYPSGRGPAGTPSLTHFFSSLNGRGTMAARVPRDEAAVRAGCPNCTNPISIFVTEMGAGNAGGSYTQFMKGYPDVPYIATELLQGIAANVSNVDIFALTARYPGSLLDGADQLTDVGQLYATFFTPFGHAVLGERNGTLVPGVHLLVVDGKAPGTTIVFVVNTNTTVNQPIVLPGSGLPLTSGTVRSWNSTNPAPRVVNYTLAVPSVYIVPPEGILEVQVGLFHKPPFAPTAPGLGLTGTSPPSTAGVPALPSAPAVGQLAGATAPPAARPADDA